MSSLKCRVPLCILASSLSAPGLAAQRSDTPRAATNFAQDRDIVAMLNPRRPLRTSSSAASFLKYQYYDRNSQIDFSASPRLTRSFRAYVEGLNLNNALLRYYQGVPERVLQEEHYRWWSTFGVKVGF